MKFKIGKGLEVDFLVKNRKMLKNVKRNIKM